MKQRPAEGGCNRESESYSSLVRLIISEWSKHKKKLTSLAITDISCAFVYRKDMHNLNFDCFSEF